MSNIVHPLPLFGFLQAPRPEGFHSWYRWHPKLFEEFVEVLLLEFRTAADAVKGNPSLLDPLAKGAVLMLKYAAASFNDINIETAPLPLKFENDLRKDSYSEALWSQPFGHCQKSRGSLTPVFKLGLQRCPQLLHSINKVSGSTMVTPFFFRLPLLLVPILTSIKFWLFVSPDRPLFTQFSFHVGPSELMFLSCFKSQICF